MHSAANESEWATDRRVGFAMGILLVGIVAALFYRNEPLAVEDTPKVSREAQLNERLRDRNVAIYEDEPAELSTAEDAKNWTLPELLSHARERDAKAPLPIGQTERRALSSPSPAGDDSPPYASPDTVLRNSGDVPGPSVLPKEESFLADEQPTLRADPDSGYDEYIVCYGDTLSGIAEKTLGSPSRYRDIFEANRDRMTSPDRLQVGAALRIPRL